MLIISFNNASGIGWMTSGGNWDYTATPQAVINIFNRITYGRLVHSHHHGFYLHNARGDVVQRVHIEVVLNDAQSSRGSILNVANVIFTYMYDGFGNLINPHDPTGQAIQGSNGNNNSNNNQLDLCEEWNNNI